MFQPNEAMFLAAFTTPVAPSFHRRWNESYAMAAHRRRPIRLESRQRPPERAPKNMTAGHRSAKCGAGPRSRRARGSARDLSRGAGVSYERRRPDQTVLYRVVREHAQTLFEEVRERSDSGYGYPAHVENEFRRYIDCGILAHGFMRVHCAGCGRDEVVAFSCKGRAVCPSCAGRKMADTAARLVDERLPEARYRQWVLSFPHRLRVVISHDHAPGLSGFSHGHAPIP
ncbi:MAG: hypothetical protein D6689_20725 [Deltaproteobacteria bacterium]|nr:MAG: hypothetical protein D6689_20725 [Deltaproteobacteria bacterium]